MSLAKELMNTRIRGNKLIWPENFWKCPTKETTLACPTKGSRKISIEGRPFHMFKKEPSTKFEDEFYPSPYCVPFTDDKCMREENSTLDQNIISSNQFEHNNIRSKTSSKSDTSHNFEKNEQLERLRIENYLKKIYCDFKSIRRSPKETSRHSYVSDIVNISLNRCETGYNNEEVMRLHTRLDYEKEKLDQATDLYEESDRNFRSFLIDDWIAVQSASKNSSLLKKELKKADKIYSDLVNEEAYLINVTSKLEYKCSVLSFYRDFWKRLYSRSFNEDLECKPLSQSQPSEQTSATIKQQSEIYSEKFLNETCCYKSPYELIFPFEHMQDQNASYFINSSASNIVTQWMDAQKTLTELCEREINFTEDICNEMRKHIEWNYDLTTHLKSKFLSILNSYFHQLFSSKEVLKLETAIRYVFKRIFLLQYESAEDVCIITIVRNLEEEYRKEMDVLDNFDRKVVNQVMNRCFKEDILMMKRAEKAKASLLTWSTLVKSLYIAFEPARKVSYQDKLKIRDNYTLKSRAMGNLMKSERVPLD